ncbi:MAG TPA: 6,7-dimethyl-8-ribityllumazine synthase [Candidatus Dormibacteraeota bacterium]|nr:6,7-dimethyl-8-ribityllumazine synthase [Candidatus Dormibacteraeota bacterium]
MGRKGRQGSLEGRGLTVGIVAARYNEEIVEALVEGALRALEEHGAKAEPVLSVPGSFEIPIAAQALADAGRVDAVICLGCVIKGETAHFEHIAEGAARGIQDVALETGVPCVFGVLTTYTEEQARARTDKGREAAETAIEMANLLKTVRGREA